MNPALLLCRIGWHAPLAYGRWNEGYCFTRCRRCGRDMVRSLFGEWHVPKGHRVVWAAAPPSPTPPSGPHAPTADGPVANGAPPAAPDVAAPAAAPTPSAPPSERDEPPPATPPTMPRRSPFDFDDFGPAGG